MAGFPIVCDKCSYFGISGNFVVGTGTVVLTNCSVGRCPNCGGNLRILDGVYKLVEDTLSILSAPDTTIESLERLAEVLKSARQKETDPLELKAVIEEQSSELKGFSALLPKTRSELYAFIGLVLTIIAMLISAMRTSSPPDIHIDQVINNFETNECLSSGSVPKAMSIQGDVGLGNISGRTRKIGRNVVERL